MNKRYTTECAVCGHIDTKLKSQLWRHVRCSHGLTPEEYYNTYIREDTDPPGTCMYSKCDNKTKFRGLTKGYDCCCCRNHQMRYAWECDDGTRRDNQRRIGSGVMTEVNKQQWNNPEFRKRHSERMSKIMADLNRNIYNYPKWYANVSKHSREMMNDPKMKSYLDASNFLNHNTDGLFYCIVNRVGKMKIGVTSNTTTLQGKFKKYGSHRYFVYSGTAKEVTDLEYYIKITYEPEHGFEFFNQSYYEEFEELAKINNLKYVMSA